MQSLRFMTKALVVSVLLSSAAVGLADMTPQGKSVAPKSGWHTSFSEAQAEAKALGKPLLLHFYADWCGPCQQMERSVLNQPGVVRCLGVDVVGVKVNADHHSDLVSRFGVSGYPTDVLVSPEGSVSVRSVGMSSQSSFIDRMKREGAKYPAKTEIQVAESSANEHTTHKPAIAKKADDVVGLDGYSPVALATGKLWKKGLPEFNAEHQGVTYWFANDDERELFEEDPARYAPKLLGCDPVILSDSGRAVRGNIEHGAFFRQGVFLMATEENRDEFLKNPAFYADKRFAVEVEEIEQFVKR
jgi:thiol-disulfide isomerase/thioredoxin